MPLKCVTQDYDVNDIQCAFSSSGSSIEDLITAKLKRPVGFKGAPMFADDHEINTHSNRYCLITKDPNDDVTYSLRITNFSRCGVLKRNGFVHVRIWFPQFPGVVMQSDQELIIMCKPPEPTVIENKAAGFAGSFPHEARVSGVVEETPNRLEYEVALYKEAPPVARISGTTNPVSTTKDVPALSTASELPVDQAVPIGTKLQLRARISAQSVWKYIKLMEVTVSSDPDHPLANGAVSLVRDGCRNREFVTIIPHQPAKYRDRPNEVFLDFEAFLLSSMKVRATLWIHSQIKACMDAKDCAPNFCIDTYEPSGQGRKKRNLVSTTPNNNYTSPEFARFKENIKYTVILPSELDTKKSSADGSTMRCQGALLITFIFIMLFALCIAVICLLTVRVQSEQKLRSLQITSGFNSGYGYAGRTIDQ
ncbi:uncharacterized protein LOC115631402 [Scaptodrosophila lebanonensis]|uniref:Uncharacterized protein LOC115631402 n=1 Tax=Drosophila lebanonensis TaxID=7225 RepID=A0A6J2U6M6_DROLE|nr:uncharacterized protein LOC115631402 [Scaptodrosophila lebanonensis]